MRRTCMFLYLAIPLYSAANLSAQQLFEESGQSLGYGYSTSVRLGDLDMFLACGSILGSPFSNRIWMNTTIENEY